MTVLHTVEGSLPLLAQISCAFVWLVIGLFVGDRLRSWRAERLQSSNPSPGPSTTLASCHTPTKQERLEARRAYFQSLLEATLEPDAEAPKGISGLESDEDDAEEEEKGADENDDDGDWEDENEEEEESDEEESEMDRLAALRLKMVLIVCRPPATSTAPALTAAQTASSSLDAALRVTNHITQTAHGRDRTIGLTATEKDWVRWLIWWNQVGVAKITLRCPKDDPAELQNLHRLAVELQLPCALSDDERVLAVGPAPSEKLDAVSGKLKLLS